jgi:hypothetical protein
MHWANLALIPIVGTGPPTHGVSVGAARTHGAPTQAVRFQQGGHYGERGEGGGG